MQANLMIHLKGVRDEHIKYTAELARYSNEVTTTYKETPRADQENRSVDQSGLRIRSIFGRIRILQSYWHLKNQFKHQHFFRI